MRSDFRLVWAVRRRAEVARWLATAVGVARSAKLAELGPWIAHAAASPAHGSWRTGHRRGHRSYVPTASRCRGRRSGSETGRRGRRRSRHRLNRCRRERPRGSDWRRRMERVAAVNAEPHMWLVVATAPGAPHSRRRLSKRVQSGPALLAEHAPMRVVVAAVGAAHARRSGTRQRVGRQAIRAGSAVSDESWITAKAGGEYRPAAR